jgi:hypothetical protein
LLDALSFRFPSDFACRLKKELRSGRIGRKTGGRSGTPLAPL